MVSIMDAGIGAVIGIITIVIFVEVFHAIPTTNFSSGSVALLNIVDLVLAAAILIAIVAFGFSRR